jgi:hypothetical protein
MIRDLFAHSALEKSQEAGTDAPPSVLGMYDRVCGVATIGLGCPDHGETGWATLPVQNKAGVTVEIEMVLAEQFQEIVRREVAVADDADIVVMDEPVDSLSVRLLRGTRGIAGGQWNDGS